MLLIGDVHITTRQKDRIINELNKFIEKYPDEKNIVFLGDYVYHFSYDRNSLIALYHFFVQLFEKGKNVYVLAGNHDWIGSGFVFEEAQRAFDIIHGLETKGKLKFITKSIIENIEGNQILFLPYSLENYELGIMNYEGNEGDKLNNFFEELKKSENKNEKKSGHLNQYLLNEISKNENLIVIHHYYINNTKFPGQKSKFGYKDVALSEEFLDMKGIKLISGHLHQPFVYKNYLCVGSIWSTNSLEINQNKFFFQFDGRNIVANEVNINPYILIENNGESVSKRIIEEKIESILEENKKYLKNNEWDIEFVENKMSLKDISLVIKTSDINYEKIDDYIQESVRNEIKDVRLKKDMIEMGELIKNFEISAKNLSESFGDRKGILKMYLEQKYGKESSKYEKVLNELKLM